VISYLHPRSSTPRFSNPPSGRNSDVACPFTFLAYHCRLSTARSMSQAHPLPFFIYALRVMKISLPVGFFYLQGASYSHSHCSNPLRTFWISAEDFMNRRFCTHHNLPVLLSLHSVVLFIVLQLHFCDLFLFVSSV
jgi:hypothetical protein